MAIPGVPSGAAASAAQTALQAPVSALQDAAAALKSIADAALAAVPLLGTLGDKLKQFGETFKNTFRDYIGVPITDGLKAIGRAVKFALSTDALEYLQNAGQKIAGAFGAVGKALGSVAAGAAVAGGAVAALGLALGQLVQKASPAIYEQFTLALNDTLAVIGQALLPVFRLVTEVLRAFGDTLVTFAGSVGGAVGTVLKPFAEILKGIFELFGQLGQALGGVLNSVAPALAAVGNAFLAIFQAVQPVVTLLVDLLGGALGAAFGALASVIETIAPVVAALARAFGDLLSWVTGIIREVLAFVGVDLPDSTGKGTKPGGSVGAAARQAQIGSVESNVQAAQRAAFSLGNTSEDPAKRTASAVEALKEKADKIYNALKSLPKDIALAIADPFGITSSDDPLSTAASTFEAIGNPGSAALKAVSGGSGSVGGDFIRNAVAWSLEHAGRRGADGSGTVPAHGLGSR